MFKVVWRLERWMPAAVGTTDTSTRLSSGTSRPSRVRTMNCERSSTRYCSAPAKRTFTGTSLSPRRNSRKVVPRSAMPTKLPTSSALKPNAAARSRSTRTFSSLLRSPASTRTSRSSGRRASKGTICPASSSSCCIESPTSATDTPGCWLPPPLSPLRPMPMVARADCGSSLRMASTSRAVSSIFFVSKSTTVEPPSSSLKYE